ncbi:MAG: hypothetical protein CM1200mP36_05350 [Gammaproteobacteria bacterium]|nr:MAG: hypothetical protein CM1200mP36_05350 [Gammaproteobacteria bacterium]
MGAEPFGPKGPQEAPPINLFGETHDSDAHSSKTGPVYGVSCLRTGNWLRMADTIAVIGTGNVGGALGPEFAAQGHDIVYGSREPERADVQELVARTPGNAAERFPPKR